MVTAQQAIKWIAGHISDPGDNSGKIMWGLAGHPALTGSAWCGCTLYADALKLELDLGPFTFADVIFVPGAVNVAKEHGLWGISKNSHPGDWVAFEWGAGSLPGADHFGMIVANDPAKDYVTTIEGNAGRKANGQRGVDYHTRSRSLIAGTINRQAAYTKPIPPKPKPQPAATTLYKGVTGSAVKSLQAGLQRVFPAYAGPIRASGGADGIFGSGTEAVVREFQRRSHLTADGVVGPKTRAALAQNGVKL